MSERVERLIKEYPKKKIEARCLELQIKDFKGISESEMIESMNFSQHDGDRIQTSNISNKPESITLSYHERMERANLEWYEYLSHKYYELSEELRFFECAVKSLRGTPGQLLSDLVLNGITWDEAESKYLCSRTMICKYRRAAIQELTALYDDHEKKMAAFLLS